jgi:hypothetical protein
LSTDPAAGKPVTMQRIPLRPDHDGIARVQHALDTQDVLVKCETGDGIPVGYRAATIVSNTEVEVATVPGSGAAVAVVTRADDQPPAAPPT